MSENLFFTKIRTTFVLSNVGFPTLIDLTNLTRETLCRPAGVSSFLFRGWEEGGGSGGCRPGGTDGVAGSGFREAVTEKTGQGPKQEPYLRPAEKEPAKRGPFPEAAGCMKGRIWRHSARASKEKERFHSENPIFFSIFASIGKIMNLNAEVA